MESGRQITNGRHVIEKSALSYKKNKIYYEDRFGRKVDEEQMKDYPIYESEPEVKDHNYYIIKTARAGYSKQTKKYFINEHEIFTPEIKEKLRSEESGAMFLNDFKDERKELRMFLLDQIYGAVLYHLYETKKICENLELENFVIELVGDKLCMYYTWKIQDLTDMFESLEKILNSSVITNMSRRISSKNITEILNFINSNKAFFEYFIEVSKKNSFEHNVVESPCYNIFLCNAVYCTLKYLNDVLKENDDVEYSFEDFGWYYNVLEDFRPAEIRSLMSLTTHGYLTKSRLPIASTLRNITTSIQNDGVIQLNVENIREENKSKLDKLEQLRKINRNFKFIDAPRHYSPTSKKTAKSILKRTNSNSGRTSLRRSSSSSLRSARSSVSPLSSFNKKTKKHVAFNKEVLAQPATSYYDEDDEEQL